MIFFANGNCNSYRLCLLGDTLKQSLSPLVSWKRLFISDILDNLCRNHRFLYSLPPLVNQPSSETRFLSVC